MERWIGTNDAGATNSDPSGGGASGNNMKKVEAFQYDGGSAGGNGNLTQQTQYAGDTDTRVTTFGYDFRNRRTFTDGEIDFYETYTYDNLDRTTRTERRNTSSGGNLIGRNETLLDSRGGVYRTLMYAVNPANTQVGNSLRQDTWYDPSGNIIKLKKPGSGAFEKSVYDGVNRLTKRYVAYDTSETNYADAGSVANDTVMRQEEISYDAAGNVIQQTTRDRFHDATGTGPWVDPGTNPKARINYIARYPDALGREVVIADYGTNGASSFTRPSAIPARSDTVLVTTSEYNNRGELFSVKDPKATETRQAFDNFGRLTQKIENYVSGGTNPDQNQTTESPTTGMAR